MMKKSKDDIIFCCVVILWLSASTLMVLFLRDCVKTQLEENNKNIVVEIVNEDEQEDRKIIEALIASGYFNESIPLTYEEQALLHSACDEFDVPFPLMVAMIQKETMFMNVSGDSGDSEGYLQIQKKWCKREMEEIGATDLMNPVDNFRTGCKLMHDNMVLYSLEDSLTKYNSGHTGESSYAKDVMYLFNFWSEVVG